MDFHGMNRKNLQILCKKHGIPANLKNSEMANRLASLFLLQKGDEETVTETKVSTEEEEADDGIKEEEVVARRKAKKVRFSPETDNQVFEFTRSVKKNVRTLPRRSSRHQEAPQQGGGIERRRSERSVSKGIGSYGDVSSSVSGIVEDEKEPSNLVEVTRRSKRIGSSGSAQEEGKDTELIAPEQGGRRSTRLAARIEKSCVEGGASKPVALLPAAKRSKRVGSSSSSSTQEEGKDNDLTAPERFEGKDIQDGRRSRRLAAKSEKSFEEGGTSKSVTLLVAAKRSKCHVDVANKEDEKEGGERQRKDDDSKVELVRRRSMRFVNEQTDTQDQRRRSVRLRAIVGNPSMGQAVSKLKNDTVKAARVVKGNMVDKKTDENLVKSSKRLTRNMKRDRSAESEMDKGTASNQSNLPPKKSHFEQQEACGADVKARGSSKKSKAMNQECIKDKPQGIVITEDSPSSSKTKAAESGMILEKIFNPTLDKSDDSSQRSNTREMKCERMEGDCEEKLERDTVSVPVMEEDNEEVSSRSLSSPKDKLHVPAGHIILKDVFSTVIAEESSKTKDESLKEHSSIANLANVEEILENSTECWKEIHSGKDDEKGSFEKDEQAENLHGNVSECNTENSSADEEVEISTIGVMSVAHCVNLTPEQLLGEYAQLEAEEARRPNEEASCSSQKMKKTVGQEFVKDQPQKTAEGSPSTSETKATEPSESVLDSTQKVSGYTSAVRNSHELNSEILEEGREEKHEQATTKKDNGEASSLSEFLIESSEVKTSPDNRSTGCSLSVETTLPPALVKLAMSNPEADLGLPTGDDIVSAVLTEEDKITKEETLIFTPASELKEHGSVAELTKVEVILGNSAEGCKEDEKGSLEKDAQAKNLHGNYSEGNTENSSAEEEMEISKDNCMSTNLTAEKLLDTYTPLGPEEAGGPHVEIRSSSKTMSSEFLKENPQGMVEDSPSTFVTKTTETIMMSENVSVDISPVGLNPELKDDEREEKQELDIVLVAETEKEKKKASSPSPSEFLIERPEVSIPESELFVETAPPPPSSVHIAVSNPGSELSEPTGHILVKDIVSPVIAEEDSKTGEGPKSVHSFVAKLAETDAVLENSAECWNESLSSKDDERGSLEKERQSAKRHGNFSEYNAENSSAEDQADICEVGRISGGHCVDRETLDEVKDESLMKSVQTVSSERGCKPNALELSGSLSTDFASHSHKEENVSECLEGEEMKALSQSTPINKTASNTLDMSSLFTTRERDLMLMEKLSESGKIRAADTVTQHNDEAVESRDVLFTTPERVLLKTLNTSEKEAFNEGERKVVELHDESDIAASPLRQPSVGDFKEEITERNEENRTVELHCESGTCTGPDKHAAFANFVSDGAENSGGNKAMEFYEEFVAFTGLEERHELFGDSGEDKASEDDVKKDEKFYEEAGLSTEMHKGLPLVDPELGEPGWLGINNADKSGSLEGHLMYGDSEQRKAVKPAEKASAEFHDVSAVPNIPEESGLDEASKSQENNTLELQADCDNFTGANITAKSHDMSDVLTASGSHSLMGDFELDEDENKHRENKDVELLDEPNVYTNVDRHLLSEESGLAETREMKYSTAAICEESSVFISPERRQHLENSEPLTAGKQEQKEVEFKDESAFFTRLEARLLLGESGQNRLDSVKSGSAQCQRHLASSPKVILKDDSVVREGHVASPDLRENAIIDFSGRIPSKVSYSHEISAEEETASAEFVGLDAMQGTSEESRENSPHVDSVMDAHVLALPAEGNSETTGEISNHIEVAGTCSLVSEESGPSIDFQNQIHDAVEELPITDELVGAKLSKNTQSASKTISLPAEGDSKSVDETISQLEVTGTCSMVSEKSIPSMDIQNHINDALEEELSVTDNTKADELIEEAKVTKNLDSSGGSDISGKIYVLDGTEDEHFEKKDISHTPDESAVQKNRTEEAADGKMLKREATPSPEETLNESSENIGESGTSSEKQARREPVLIYRTQVKPKRHDMKENAPNSKIVDNLNVTAPRTSKRQPLQHLRKN